jgi:cell growth-regulating nucleolar protein
VSPCRGPRRPPADHPVRQSCISEAQKYQGALYKDKATKAKKSVTIAASTSLVPRMAYVEDAPDVDLDNDRQVSLINHNGAGTIPRAPSPPPVVNVFDYLVTEDTPNASRVSLGGSKEQMSMVAHAQPLFQSGTQSPRSDDDDDRIREPRGYEHGDDGNDGNDGYEDNGYVYGATPVATNPTHNSYLTPAPKSRPNGRKDAVYELDGRGTKSTDKKRKRQVEELDLTQARRPSQEIDEVMHDADPLGRPNLLHSGLTGGLHRLLSRSKFPPSPDYSGGDANDVSPVSPVKRKKELADKSRGRASSALVRVRKVRRTSDESRPRKHHRSHRHGHDEPKRTLKAIEYPGHGTADQQQQQQQLIVYRTRAELFMSFVTKGPESENGCSVNKALKRYHRERGEQGLGMGKADEEKELWKSLRLKRNERGEIVLLI